MNLVMSVMYDDILLQALSSVSMAAVGEPARRTGSARGQSSTPRREWSSTTTRSMLPTLAITY